MQPDQLPEWIQYIAGFVILTVTGVAARMGLTSAKSAPAPVAAAAIVNESDNVIALDPRTIKALSGVLDELTQSLEDMHKDRLRCNKESREELVELRADIRSLTRQIERAVEHLKQ